MIIYCPVRHFLLYLFCDNRGCEQIQKLWSTVSLYFGWIYTYQTCLNSSKSLEFWKSVLQILKVWGEGRKTCFVRNPNYSNIFFLMSSLTLPPCLAHIFLDIILYHINFWTNCATKKIYIEALYFVKCWGNPINWSSLLMKLHYKTKSNHLRLLFFLQLYKF